MCVQHDALSTLSLVSPGAKFTNVVSSSLSLLPEYFAFGSRTYYGSKTRDCLLTISSLRCLPLQISLPRFHPHRGRFLT